VLIEISIKVLEECTAMSFTYFGVLLIECQVLSLAIDLGKPRLFFQPLSLVLGKSSLKKRLIFGRLLDWN
jgi:hypothetical protein